MDIFLTEIVENLSIEVQEGDNLQINIEESNPIITIQISEEEHSGDLSQHYGIMDDPSIIIDGGLI